MKIYEILALNAELLKKLNGFGIKSEDFAWTMGFLMRNAVWLLGEPCT